MSGIRAWIFDFCLHFSSTFSTCSWIVYWQTAKSKQASKPTNKQNCVGTINKWIPYLIPLFNLLRIFLSRWQSYPNLFLFSFTPFPVFFVFRRQFVPESEWTWQRSTVVMEILICIVVAQLFDYHNCSAVSLVARLFGVQSTANGNRRCKCNWRQSVF